ncbi:MAG: diguanylate cyclase, partial [Burkholderiales bacterium]
MTMEILERIEEQIAASGLPLFGITLAAVPCPDTPLILTLHWHGFIREKLADVEQAEPVSYTPLPSSALQLNDRWRDLLAVDRAAMEAAWELGAWDVARAERKGCMRP